MEEVDHDLQMASTPIVGIHFNTKIKKKIVLAFLLAKILLALVYYKGNLHAERVVQLLNSRINL